jgi:hypothetical protein
MFAETSFAWVVYAGSITEVVERKPAAQNAKAMAYGNVRCDVT